MRTKLSITCVLLLCLSLSFTAFDNHKLPVTPPSPQVYTLSSNPPFLIGAMENVNDWYKIS